MNCPVCKRELAPTLSICLTCGAMMNDTVREELETTVGKIPSGPLTPTKIEFVETPKPAPVVQPKPIVVARPEPPQRPKTVTAELSRRDTSPTLVGFQPKNPAIPDWRLELQNSIRKRNGGVSATVEPAAPQMAAPAVSAAAPVMTDEAPAVIKNERVANALKRIEESRKAFSAAPVATPKAAPIAAKKAAVPNRSFPFNVVERTQNAARQTSAAAELSPSPKPQLVSSLRIEKKKFDTNKLPPIPEPELPLATLNEEVEDSHIVSKSFERMSIRNEADIEIVADVADELIDEIDDLAPLSMRFGASVFDLIIGGFAAAILLSPFFISNVELATASGFLAIGGAVLVVMFIYQTATIAFMGRTFGMKLFSIEIIDAEANELPTLHQSAVNSAVYLLSLLLGGIGFLPALFNEERRTIHDMLSGTILIREY
jgi:uncharacterized RDD family membrane protein YckC